MSNTNTGSDSNLFRDDFQCKELVEEDDVSALTAITECFF